MAENIRKLIDDVIDREKGYVNHPADRGGPTKHGITLKTLEAWRGVPVEARDVELLDKDEAREIYESVFYYTPRIDRLPAEIQPVVFDMAVNHGPRTAIKLVQQVISLMGRSVNPDGIIGQYTVIAANIALNAYHGDVVRQIVNRRIEYYHQIVKDDPSQVEFLAGWLNRARQFTA